MTKQELLKQAKTLKINGRHEMSKVTLQVAIQKALKKSAANGVHRGKPFTVEEGHDGTSTPIRAWNKWTTRGIEQSLPPQLVGLLECMKKHSGKKFTLKTLGETAVAERFVVTRQPAARIAYWYRKQLHNLGAIQQ